MAAPNLDFRPTQLDLNCEAGDAFTVRFEFIDDITEDPFPLDPLGEWTAQVRLYALAGDPVGEFVVDTSELVDGVVSITLPAETAALLIGLRLRWDLQEIATDVPPKTWYSGNLFVAGDVSRAL